MRVSLRAFAWLLILAAAGRAAPADTRAIGSHLELFVDRYLIDTVSGAELRLNHPEDAGNVLSFDRPWEGPDCNYVTMILDGSHYRCYYRGVAHPAPDGIFRDGYGECTCLALSDDGIHWKRPDFGIFGHTNELLADPTEPCSHDFTPFIDTRPGCPASERYKALAGLWGTEHNPASTNGYVAFVSGDGIHWRKLREEAVITRANYPVRYVDISETPAFWSVADGCYVAYMRTWADSGHAGWRGHDWAAGGTVRSVGRLTSPDFIHWSKVRMMDFGDAPLAQLYNNVTSPYFRAPHILIATPPRIVFDRPAITPEQADAIKVEIDESHDNSEPVLITSRGGNHYDWTFREAFIRNGIGPRNWTSRDNYPALNIIPTGPEEISLYTVADYAQPTCHLERFALATDRFASVYAPFRGGEFTTRPLTFTGRSLYLNFSTSVAGGIRVEIEDAAGRPIPGYSLADAVELVGNDIERPVQWKTGATPVPRSWQGDISEPQKTFHYTFWKGGADIGKLAGIRIRLRIVMKEADVYALRFR